MEESAQHGAEGLNVDPNKKGRARLTLEERNFQAARAKIERELEQFDASPERLKLFKRAVTKGACRCDSCAKRRLYTAMQRVNKDDKTIAQEAELNGLIQTAFKGDYPTVLEGLKKHREALLNFFGGPIAVLNCNECKGQHPAIPCYHCGREPWMKTRKDMIKSRKDVKVFAASYITTGLLHAACLSGHVNLCKKLVVDLQADVNAQDELGHTPLHWLCCSGHKREARQLQYVAIAETLLAHGADVTIMDNWGKTPTELTLLPFTSFNQMRMTVLKHAKPQLNENLLAACQSGDLDIAVRMIQAGADLLTGDWLNDTPLHVSVTFGHHDLTDKLLEIAKQEGRLLTVIKAENVEGQTCVDVAIKWGYKSTASKLKETAVEQQVKEMVLQIGRGGTAKVPAELKGTLLGQQVEAELKEQSKMQKRMVKALRLEQIAQKRESKRKNFKGQTIEEGAENEGGGGSRTCVIA